MAKIIPPIHLAGWIPDPPDENDVGFNHPRVRKHLQKLGAFVEAHKKRTQKLPTRVDLSSGFPPVRNQESLNTCTAFVISGLLSYFVQKAHETTYEASPLFLYKATRDLLQVTGDTGAALRSALGAVTLLGAPAEKYWPYDLQKFEDSPPSFCFALARDYRAEMYYKLDKPPIAFSEILKRVKTSLGASVPASFGVKLSRSFSQAEENGRIPFPKEGDPIVLNHALVAVGYDDSLVIQNSEPDGPKTIGALKIRNSWGEQWGEQGYGWLPYEFVLKGRATDWWTLLKASWTDSEQFGLR